MRNDKGLTDHASIILSCAGRQTYDWHIYSYIFSIIRCSVAVSKNSVLIFTSQKQL